MSITNDSAREWTFPVHPFAGWVWPDYAPYSDRTLTSPRTLATACEHCYCGPGKPLPVAHVQCCQCGNERAGVP